jgi:hypothetical protein
LGIEETQYTNYYKNPYIRKNGMKMIYAWNTRHALKMINHKPV